MNEGQIRCFGCGQGRPARNREVTCRRCEEKFVAQFTGACVFSAQHPENDELTGVRFFRAIDKLIWRFAVVEEEET